MIFASALAGSFFCGIIFGRIWLSKRHYELGFQHGECHGRHLGYRAAWLKRHRIALLDPQTEDWYDR